MVFLLHKVEVVST